MSSQAADLLARLRTDPWEYEIDQYGAMGYTPPGDPFIWLCRRGKVAGYNPGHDGQPRESSLPYAVLGGAIEHWASLRLAPNLEFYAWGNEYVLFSESVRQGDPVVRYRAHVGGEVVIGWAAGDPEPAVLYHVRADERPDPDPEWALARWHKLVAFVERSRQDRDARREIVTAHQRYDRERAA